ncbi:hypothetical protein ACJZ2D_003408 [Fusarium nematophilum]
MTLDKPNTSDVENASTDGSPHVLVPETANRRIRQAFDRRVLPLVCCLYVLSYLDRGNIGNAKTAGAQEALNLSSSQWAWVLNSFYISYILFEWTTMFWKLFPAHIYVASLCLAWGAAAMSSGAARNMAELIVTRVFLGIFEATFGAGAPYFLSCIYKRGELGFRMSILLGMSPLANTFASSLAYGITHINGSLEPWRLLFIIEGAPTILFAPVVYFFMIDSPSTAKFLTEEERSFAVARLQVRDNSKQGVKWKQVLAGVLDYKNYVHAIMHFCCNFSFAALSNFLPTIVNSMGYDSITAQGLTAPAYFTAFLLCILAAFVSDRYGSRGFIVAGFGAMGAVGYGLLAGVQDMDRTGPRYAGVWLAACGIFPALSINVTWLLNNQGGDSKRGAGLAILLIIGQCSSLISSTVFPSEDAPFFTTGCAIGCGMSGLIVVLALGMHFALARENKQRFQHSIHVTALPRVFQDALKGGLEEGSWHDGDGIFQVLPQPLCTLLQRATKDLPLFKPRSLEPFSISEVDLGDSGWCTLHPYNLWDNEVASAPLKHRGWVIQERLLSPRVVHFGRRQLAWKCLKLQELQMDVTGTTLWETGNPRISHMRIGSKDPIEPESRRAWNLLVKQYSRSKLTNPGDKLVAFSGIAKRIAVQRQDEYVAGFWKSALMIDLPWMKLQPGGCE